MANKISNRPTSSCIRCYERKVKCDKKHPCGACLKHHAECIFRPPPVLTRRKERRLKHAVLKDRLNQCEALLHANGIESPRPIETSEDASQMILGAIATAPHLTSLIASSPTSTPRPNRSISTTQLLRANGHDRSQLVANPLWTRVAEELQDSPGFESTSSSDDNSDAESDSFEYILNKSPKHVILPHPTTEQISQLWTTFVVNVDPLTKLVHAPTLGSMIINYSSDINNLPRNLEAMMFAVYSAAILSQQEQDCLQQFCMSKDALLSLYLSATKIALSRAKFMETNSIMVLQALVLHIFTIRDIYEPRAVWILTGVALRVGEGMGLQKDGQALGLSPFETEMRRRIWWQLKMHDGRTAELNGQIKFQDWEKMPTAPTDLDDNELDTDMDWPKQQVLRATDSIFCSAKVEMGLHVTRQVTAFERRRGPINTWNEFRDLNDMTDKEKNVEGMLDVFETKFLRFCDPTNPLQLFTMLYYRCCANVGRFLAHHPRRWTNAKDVADSEKQVVWDLCLKMLEQYDMMQSSQQLKGFAWYVTYFIQWQALVHVLDTLQAQPTHAQAEKAWRLVRVMYENNPIMLSAMKRPLYAAIGTLCLDAYQAREANIDRAHKNAPLFIMTLRDWRAAVAVRRQSRSSKHAPTPIAASATMTTTMNILHDRPAQLLDECGTSMINDHTAPILSSISAQEYSQGSATFDTAMNWGMPQHDHEQQSSPAYQGIDWNQWDAWLSNSMNGEIVL